VRLVAVRETTHARHHAQDVVVQRIHADLRRARARDRVERDRQLERGLVDTREVARARRLVLLGAQGERVNVDTHRRRTAVVLVGLDAVKVGALTFREAVLAVELQLGNLNRVLALAADTRVKDDLGEQVVNTRLKLTRARKIRAVRANDRRRLRSTRAKHRRSASRRDSTARTLGNGRACVRLRQERRDDTVRAEVIRVVERLGTANRREPRRR